MAEAEEPAPRAASTGGVGACGDDPLQAQTDDASTDTTTARAMTREAACTHFGAVSGSSGRHPLSERHTNAGISLDDLSKPPPGLSKPPSDAHLAITNQMDDPKARQYYRKNPPQHDRSRPIRTDAASCPRHPPPRACLSSLWVTELSA